MNSIASLSGSHLRTYQTIFQHPVSHNLGWRDVHALFRQIAQVEEEPNGNLKVTRHGQVLVLRPPRTKDVAEVDELMGLRHFIEKSLEAPVAAADSDMHWLVVLDHHECRLFRSVMAGAVPEQILPHAPDEAFRQAHHAQDFSRGREKPDLNSFFMPVAQALQAAGRILIFGTGTGTSSEMDQFVAWVKRHHPELDRRIIGALVVDENHLTDGQLLAQAREFYLRPART